VLKNYIEKIENIADIQRLIEKIEDSETIKFLDFLKSQFDSVRNFIKENSLDNKETEGMCLTVSRYFNELLSKDGFRSKVLQGDIEEEEDSWIEHHVSLIFLENEWIIVDFTVNQISRYKDLPLLVLICRPDKISLKKVLKGAYDWWISES